MADDGGSTIMSWLYMTFKRGDGWKAGCEGGSLTGSLGVILGLVCDVCFSGVPRRVDENSGRREISPNVERDDMLRVLLTGGGFDLGLPCAVILFNIERGFIFSLRAGFGTANTLPGLAGATLGFLAERGVLGNW